MKPDLVRPCAQLHRHGEVTLAVRWASTREGRDIPLSTNLDRGIIAPEAPLSYDPSSDPNLPRRPIAPHIPDRNQLAQLPLPRKIPESITPGAFRASDVVPPEDNPLAGWRGLGLGRFNQAMWRDQGMHNPLVAYYSGRMRGHLVEDIIGLTPWMLMTLTLAVLAVYPTIKRDDFLGIILAGVIVVPMVAFISTVTCVSMHVRRTIASLPLEELLLTRLRPLEIVVGLGVRPIAIQNVGMFCYILSYFLICLYRFSEDTSTAGAMYFGTILIVGFMQSFLSTAVIEFTSAAAIRCALFLRSAWIGWLRAVLDSCSTVLSLLVPVGTLVVLCGGLGATGRSAAVVAFFLIILAISPTYSWVQDFAWDPIYWSVRYHREWWVFQAKGRLAGDAPERTLLSPWRPLDVRAGFASRANLDKLRYGSPRSPKKNGT